MSSQIGLQDLNIRTVESGEVTWINVVQPSAQELEWLADSYGFHPMSLQETRSHGQTSTLDDYETYVSLSLHFPVFDEQSRITIAAELDIFAGDNYVVTIYGGGIQRLVTMFEACEADEPTRVKVFGDSSGYLLYSIMAVLSEHCFAILEKLDADVDEMEMMVFEERPKDLVRDISYLRRDIIFDLRIMRHQVAAIGALVQIERPFLKVEANVYFGEIEDSVRNIVAELDELKEAVDGLADANDTLINHQTNRIIRILTIMSAILLPLTVVSGVFGMNVNIPFANAPFAFGAVAAAMLIVAVGMLIFFRWRNWI